MTKDEEKKKQEFFDKTNAELDVYLDEIKKNPDDEMAILRYAKKLEINITIFGMSGSPEGIALVLERFRKLVQEYGHMTQIQNLFATAIANSMSYLMKKHKYDTMFERLEELRLFAKTHPTNMNCQRSLAGGLVNSIINFGQRKVLEPVKEIIQELLILAETHKENHEIQLCLVKGLVNSMGYLSRNEDYEPAIPLLDDLMALTDEHPNDEDFILQRANGIVTAMNAFAKNDKYVDLVEELEEELERMAKIYPDHEGVQLRAKTKTLGRD
ncbi:MAG: hypothetical protein ACTSUW_01195 [Candidatus Heimdallarchaeota archaeon]